MIPPALEASLTGTSGQCGMFDHNLEYFKNILLIFQAALRRSTGLAQHCLQLFLFTKQTNTNCSFCVYDYCAKTLNSNKDVPHRFEYKYVNKRGDF